MRGRIITLAAALLLTMGALDAKAESTPARSQIQRGPVPYTIPTTKTPFVVEVYVYTEEERSQRAIFASLITARDRFLDLYRCSILQHEKWKSLHANSLLTPEGSSLPFYRYGGIFMAECRLNPAQDSDNINFSAPSTPGAVMNQEAFDFKCTDQEDEGITIGKFPKY